MDCQQFSPLLQYDFYQDLCKKYPKVFRRRLTRSEAGKCLFKTHVGLKEDARSNNEGGMMLSSPAYEDIANKHSTNWEKEVGHYFQHKSQNSRVSGEQMVCSDSFLNSQPLNKHLHEHSPLQRMRRFKDADIQNESEHANGSDHTLENYIIENGKNDVGRSRQERVSQHKIYSAKNSAYKFNNEYKCVSPTSNGKHSPSALLPRLPRSKYTNSVHVDVNTVLADRNLKVLNPSKKMNMKTDSMDSTPDSAIDIDTPSIESLMTTVYNSVKMTDKHVAIPIASEHIGKYMGYDIELRQGSATVSNSIMKISADSGRHADQYNGNESYAHSSNKIVPKSSVHGGSLFAHSTQCNCIESPQIQYSGYGSVHSTLSTSESVHSFQSDIKSVHRTQSGSEFVHSSSTDANDKYDENKSEKCDNAQHSCFNNDNCKNEVKLVNDIINSSNKNEPGLMQLCHADAESVCTNGLSVTLGCNHDNLIASTVSTAMPGCLRTGCSQNCNSYLIGQTDNLSRESDGCTSMSHHNGKEGASAGKEGAEIRNQQAEDPMDGESLTVVNVAETKHPKQTGTLRDSDVDSGIGIGKSRSDVDISTPDEATMEGIPHDHQRKGLNFYNETDDTDIRLGVIAVSDTDKKIAEKYRTAKAPSPYILINCNRLNSPCKSGTKSAHLINYSDLDLKAVHISMPDESFSDSSSVSFTASLPNGNIHKNESLTKITFFPSSYQNVDINSNESSICIKPHDTFSNIILNSHQPNIKSSSLHSEQRKQSLTSSSSAEDSVSSLSEMDTLSKAHSITSIDSLAKTSSVQYQNEESSTDVLCADDNGISLENGAGKITMKTGKFQPSGSPSRVKENRLQLANLLRNKKGCFNLANYETSANTWGDGNELHRIYAKNRRNTKDNLKNPVNIDIVHSEKEPIFSDINSFGSSIEKKCDKPFENESYGLANRQWVEQYINREFAGQDKEHDVARLIIRNADRSISGTKETTLTVDVSDNKCDHSDLDILACDSVTLPTDNLDNKAEQIAVLKTEPPKKPARTKKTNLCSDLNSSMINMQTNVSDQVTLNELFKCRSELDINHQSEIKLRSNIDEQKKQHVQAICQGNSAYRDRTMLFCATNGFDEIEIMSPQTSSLKKSKAVSKGMSASKVSLVDSLKSATLGKFKAFRKSVSLEKGIDTCVVERNSASVRSKEKRFSGMHKMKKAPSLQSIASYFGRKKKRGKFIFDNSDTSSNMGSSLSISSANFVPLSKDKHIKLPSSQSLPSNTSPAHSYPIGKLLDVYTDGTQLIQLYKPQDGPFGFFIAKGNVKYGNGIFISRFNPRKPEQCFSGLLGVGDEIMEVNGRPVRDLSNDDVHRLITDSPTVVLKVFPFIARNDV